MTFSEKARNRQHIFPALAFLVASVVATVMQHITERYMSYTSDKEKFSFLYEYDMFFIFDAPLVSKICATEILLPTVIIYIAVCLTSNKGLAILGSLGAIFLINYFIYDADYLIYNLLFYFFIFLLFSFRFGKFLRRNQAFIFYLVWDIISLLFFRLIYSFKNYSYFEWNMLYGESDTRIIGYAIIFTIVYSSLSFWFTDFYSKK